MSVFGMIASFALQSDGRIVLAVPFRPEGQLIRLDAMGGRDLSFPAPDSASDRFASSNIVKIAVQPDDKIIAADRDRLVRYNADGTFHQDFNDFADTTARRTFRANGINGLIIQPDSKILIACAGFSFYEAGTYRSGSGVIRMHSDGEIDVPFASRFYDGANFLPFPRATDAALAADGRILIAGPVNEGIDGLLRAEASGDLDPSFSPLNAPRIDQFAFAPDVNGNVATLELYPDGRIIAGGSGYGCERRAALRAGAFFAQRRARQWLRAE
ncbi:MAG: hypothetical protein H0W20_08975 [Chthoniobacterales bacterium]|nr:hypothetical protein [Chthoniobacterales bacterium]